MDQNQKKILVTGAFGQIGSELVPALIKLFGEENVIPQDINIPESYSGIFERFDIRDKDKLENCIIRHNIGTIYHLVSLLSAKGEENPSLTWDININSLISILDLAQKMNLKIFWPSSIAVFGKTTPKDNTPQQTILEPNTMYGVTKVTGEQLCRYYHQKFKVDVRTIRYPGIISYKTPPGGGTTDYAVAMFYEAVAQKNYTCFVSADTTLPMMYMDDAVEATIKLMDRPRLAEYKPYNLSAISFKAQELVTAINKIIPLSVDYQPDFRQSIADSWPNSIDDSEARADWGWQHKYDLTKLVQTMINSLQTKTIA